ncbi:PPA1309 family protein [Tomitella gaofuii]|uniref:PPA1309 family protein n=1 Tax=Tomitella gaofuii TaxID=2760083 RepID=UPI0015FC9AFC|nr:PPA1309 family protein [Tomitella gaofuii]
MSADRADAGVNDLGRSIREVAEFITAEGDPWGEPPRLYALVPTAVLAETDPALLDHLDDAGLTPVEQEPLYDDADLHPAALGEILSGVSWPDAVAGCLLVREIVVLPPGADADPDAAARDPRRRSARQYTAALREGGGLSLLQMRPSPDGGGEDGAGDGDPDAVELLRYEGLGDDLISALQATFDADVPDDDR